MGEYFVIPATFINTRQKITQSQRKAENTMGENSDIVCTALTQIFEFIIDGVYQTGDTNMIQRGFGSLTPKVIFEEALTHIWQA